MTKSWDKRKLGNNNIINRYKEREHQVYLVHGAWRLVSCVLMVLHCYQ